MDIKPGDLFWISPNETNGITSDHAHPHVVAHVNAQDTVTVCALTSNMKRAKELGNVLLDDGEVNLPKQSVVVTSQVSTVDKKQLGEYIGTLGEHTLSRILAGIRFLQVMTQHHETRNQEVL